MHRKHVCTEQESEKEHIQIKSANQLMNEPTIKRIEAKYLCFRFCYDSTCFLQLDQ